MGGPLANKSTVGEPRYVTRHWVPQATWKPTFVSKYSLTGQTMSNQPLTEYILSEREAASGILSSPLATTYGRLVLEDEYVQKQNHMAVWRIPAHGAW